MRNSILHSSQIIIHFLLIQTNSGHNHLFYLDLFVSVFRNIPGLLNLYEHGKIKMCTLAKMNNHAFKLNPLTFSITVLTS